MLQAAAGWPVSDPLPSARMKQRLLFVSNLFPDQAEPYRGLDNATVLQHLRDRWDVRVISPRPSMGAWYGRSSDLHARPIDEPLRPVFLPVPYVPRFGSRWNHQLMARRLRPELAKVSSDFKWDVVLSAWLFPDGCAVAACADERPFHLIAQGSDVHRYLGDSARRAAILAAGQSARSVITRSRSLADALVSAGESKSKVHAIHNGVDLSCFRLTDKAAAREALNLKANERILLFVGNLLPVKDPTLLVKAFGLLCQKQPADNWRLVMIGKGPLRGELVALAASLGISERVTLPGPLPAADVARWMNAADVLSLTSHNEGLPNVVLEALACGLPIVSTAVGGISEVVDAPWKGILCEKRDPTLLADAVAQMAAESEPPRIAAASARSWQATADQYHSLLSNI